jgi:hypothetical protein
LTRCSTMSAPAVADYAIAGDMCGLHHALSTASVTNVNAVPRAPARPSPARRAAPLESRAYEDVI